MEIIANFCFFFKLFKINGILREIIVYRFNPITFLFYGIFGGKERLGLKIRSRNSINLNKFQHPFIKNCSTPSVKKGMIKAEDTHPDRRTNYASRKEGEVGKDLRRIFSKAKKGIQISTLTIFQEVLQ
jgi:hypothetical protein